MDTKKKLGAYSALGTFVLLAVIAWITGAFPIAVDGMMTFMTGGFRELAAHQTTFITMIVVLMAVVVLELPANMSGVYVQAKLCGQSGKHAVSELFEKMGRGNHFLLFFTLVVAEELFARWLFLGLLPKIPFLSSTIAFYLLMLAGNALWALVHLANFTEQKDRKILRVLPQFIAGIFFAYVFVAFGLLAAVLVHFASNMILFATHKNQRTSAIDGLIVAYGAVTAAISYMLMSKPLSDIAPWFSSTPVFQLESWTFWDYTLLSVLVSGCITVLFGALCYDRGESGEKAELRYLVLGIPVTIGIVYGIYALLGLLLSDSPYLILLTTIIVVFINQSSSGSGVAHVFWSGVPSMYITICCIQALGFWQALWWLVIISVVQLPQMLLNQYDN